MWIEYNETLYEFDFECPKESLRCETTKECIGNRNGHDWICELDQFFVRDKSGKEMKVRPDYQCNLKGLDLIQRHFVKAYREIDKKYEGLI